MTRTSALGPVVGHERARRARYRLLAPATLAAVSLAAVSLAAPTTAAADPGSGSGPAPRANTQVVGGRVTPTSETPWFAQVWSNGMVCGGTFIDSRHVLTAAHCVVGRGARQIRVLRNPATRLAGLVTAPVAAAVRVHPGYNPRTMAYDAAVIALPRPVSPVWLRMNLDRRTPVPGQLGMVYGFGMITQRGPVSARMQSAGVRFLEREGRCGHYGSSYQPRSMLCAAGDNRADTCDGDSGGPLTAIGSDRVTRIVGVTSWGKGCGQPNYPGIYTRVTAVAAWVNHVRSVT